MSDDLFQNLVDDFWKIVRELKKNPEDAYAKLQQGFTHESPAVRAILPRALFESKAMVDDNRDEIMMWYIDRLLHDEDIDVREKMAEALVTSKNYYRRRHEFICEPLGAGLDDENAETRSAVLLVLRAYFDANYYLDRLLDMIGNDPNEQVRWRAAVVVGGKRDWSDQFIALGDVSTNAMLLALNDPNVDFQADAATYLGRFPKPAILYALQDYVAREDVNPYPKQKAVTSISRLANKGLDKSEFIQQLKSDDPNMQRGALEIYQVVRAQESEEVSLLQGYLSAKNSNLRKLAALALVNSRDTESIEQVAQAIFAGRVPFKPVGMALANSSQIYTMDSIAIRAEKEADSQYQQAIAGDHQQIQDYIKRMSRQ